VAMTVICLLFQRNLILVPDGPYVWKYETEEEGQFQIDVRTMVKGKQIMFGLGRYIVKGGRRSNVVLVPTPSTVNTYGFQVRAGLKLSKGDEILS